MKETTYQIRITPAVHIFANGTNPLLLIKELCNLGQGVTVAQLEKIPPLEDINPEYCYTSWDIVLTTDQGVDSIKDVFIFVEDICKYSVEVRVDSIPKKIGEVLVDSKLVDPGHLDAALMEQEHVRQIREKRRVLDEASSIRVSSDKLDGFVDLIGELVIAQARLTETSGRVNDPELLSISEEVDRLSADLRDSAMSIRLVPIGTIFNKFNRLVRDLSQELGREIEMLISGGETELDKTVIEKLSDPLVHLIRNSIDHGIELPEERVRVGKPRKGTIHLSAVHSGGNVLIRIMDDGSGMDPEVIRAKALEKGIIKAEEKLSEAEIFTLIFLPGFSTAKAVTNVSGRGVGMDVVKRGIESLRGTIEVESQKGKGTTITLRLPLTMAIIDGLQIRIGGEFFVMPLSIVEECIELTRDKIALAHGRHFVNLRGKVVPYLRLREWFNIPGEAQGIEQVVVTSINGHQVGFVVDQVLGEKQTVIKGLGKFYQKAEGISGATIQGDGSVALILDVAKLIQAAGINLQV